MNRCKTLSGIGANAVAIHPITSFKSQEEKDLAYDNTHQKEVLSTEIRTTEFSNCPIYSTADVRDITVSWATDSKIKVGYINRGFGPPASRLPVNRDPDSISISPTISAPPRSPTIVSGLVSPGPSSPDPRRMESATLVTTAVTSPAQAKPRRPGLRSGTVGASANLGGGLS